VVSGTFCGKASPWDVERLEVVDPIGTVSLAIDTVRPDRPPHEATKIETRIAASGRRVRTS